MPPLVDLLGGHAPRIDGFWIGGNPGALAVQFDRNNSVYRIRNRVENGGFLRPLEGGEPAGPSLQAESWSRVANDAIAGGRIDLTQSQVDPGARSQELFPYDGSPIVESDSSIPSLHQAALRLEGVLAGRRGSWGFGTAIGYTAANNRTDVSRLPRLSRGAGTGLTLGITRRFARMGVLFGVQGRVGSDVGTIRIISRGEDGVGFTLQGLSEPDRQVISTMAPLFRRTNRDWHAVGLSASWDVAGARFVVAAETEQLHERQATEDNRRDPPLDRWTVRGRVVRFGAQHSLFQGRGLVSGWMSRRWGSGEASLASLSGVFYRSQASVLAIGSEIRYGPPDTSWTMAITGGTTRYRRDEQDYLSLRVATILFWEPSVGAAVRLRFIPGTEIGLGGVLVGHYASSQVPDPAATGPAYQALVAPALAVLAVQSAGCRLTFGVRRRLSGKASLLVGADYIRRGPNGESLAAAPPLSARRSTLTTTMAVLVGF